MLTHPLANEALLEGAWEQVRRGGHSAGVDGITAELFEATLAQELASLAQDLDSGVYRSQAYRAVNIPKESGGHRQIVIATVRDRVAQTAALLHLGPVISPLLHPCSYAYRPGKGVQDALAKVTEYRKRNLAVVLLTDVAQFFDTVPHEILFSLLGTSGVSETMTDLIRGWLRAAVVDGAAQFVPDRGLPQGLPISPLLANLYLTPFDREMVEAGWKLVRYADDLVICCASKAEAERARVEAEAALTPLGLQLGAEKTSIATFAEGFKFLGARFQGSELIPATAHPYEQSFPAPPFRPPPKAPPAGVPHTLLRTLYIQQQGSRLGCHGDRFVVTRANSTLIDLPAHHVDQIFLFGRIHMTAAAMSFCLIQGIPVYLFSGRGRYYGVLHNVGDTNYALRRRQFELADDVQARLEVSRAIIRAKVRNGKTLLQQHERNHPGTLSAETMERLGHALTRLEEVQTRDELRGVEGAAAAAFYGGYAQCFRGNLGFRHRSRRPPTDPANSLLSFAYTLVRYNLYSYLAGRGLDPAVGMLHDVRPHHPALASDLLEEFRSPIVDSLVLSVANRGMFSAADFQFMEGNPQPCYLQDESRERFLHAFEEKMKEERRHPDVDHPVNWRAVLDLQVTRFRRYVDGAVDRYVPYPWE
ncbi:MAG: CRISPR-associated endonuclease Cas1 [Candidatus Hydrogenedentes bacterium]|nr:CRISPR-associated endonuclease Cas1 [Candidatus Hydrogenedentota bacterium]